MKKKQERHKTKADVKEDFVISAFDFESLLPASSFKHALELTSFCFYTSVRCRCTIPVVFASSEYVVSFMYFVVDGLLPNEERHITLLKSVT
jgi:hypothetical protein